MIDHIEERTTTEKRENKMEREEVREGATTKKVGKREFISQNTNKSNERQSNRPKSTLSPNPKKK